MSDALRIERLKLTAFIGFHPSEHLAPQTLEVDLTLWTDFRIGPERDVDEGLVDYFELTQNLKARAAGRRFRLIEALASELAQEALVHPRVERVRVRVTKRPAAMPEVEAVSAELERTAADYRGQGPRVPGP